MWKFEITEDWSTIWSATYQERWLQLLNSACRPHVFFHPVIVRAWVDTYLPIRQMCPLFVSATCEDNQVFFPLILWKRNWKNAFLKVIVPAGFSDFDYHDPLFRNDNHSDEFWIELYEQLQHYSFDKIELDGIHQVAKSIFNEAQVDRTEQCPYIDLTLFDSYEQYESTLKSKSIKEIKRHEVRLASQGAISFRLFDKQSVNDALSTLPDMLSIHQRKYPHAYKAPNFHLNLIRSGLESGILHFSTIELNHVPISWIIGFCYRDKFSFYMPASNAAYRNCSVGKIHLLHCIQESFAAKYRTFDFLRGDEDYKLQWNTQSDTVCTLMTKREALFSRLKFALLRLRK